ncbi:hypothetical protein PCASD_09490 [Puccinia coronata f. sp. avenae]|uniref:DIS3L2 C-terminal domain-containing protein n=1 Tax=Puccinia coronata f. sp. avenae TaxID=200324 RepID=A0A2N5UK56_9BASI|nr:hypothetical protein PCASD_09490 [Puccinia coronata f. sp. avenae]
MLVRPWIRLIRRFADVVVHRQLEAVLSNSCDISLPSILTRQQMRPYGPVIQSANVLGVWDEAFDVAVPDFGIEKRVHVDQMPIDNHVHDEHANTLKLYWKQGVNVIAYLSEHSTDAHLNSIRHHTERHAKLMEESIPLEQVMPWRGLVKHFFSGAVSYGYISQEAHGALAIAMNRLSGKSNAGEDGEDASRSLIRPNGDNMRSAIKQVASG